MITFTLLALIACGGGETAAPPEGEGEVKTEAPPAEAPIPENVQKAATIADAIEKEPGRAEAILQENGTTRADFEAQLYDIASDPDQAAAYKKARAAN
jgi:hypothetical protein